MSILLGNGSPALSTNALCYESVQRALRNSGVEFLRQSLSDAFPENHLEQLKRPFKQEWEALKIAAADAILRWHGNISS